MATPTPVSTDGQRAQGPLCGLRVIEFAGLGPGPFAAMLLSDMGADVTCVFRPGTRLGDPSNITGRGRTAIIADLKEASDVEELKRLIQVADIVIEGFRPGVMERLGLGPDVLHALNPRLIYGRITGWGQHGPLSQAAGHDLNYIALAGALHAIGPKERPVPPLNLVGDYAAGSLYLVNGILAALHERSVSGQGQTIDAAITDGTFSLMSTYLAHCMQGLASEERASSMLDGGAPYYDVYETADGKHVSIGPIEPAFFKQLCQIMEIDPSLHAAQNERARWPALRRAFESRFREKSREAWCALLEGTDCCFAPVLALSEAKTHPHNLARSAFVDVAGIEHPAPAPRFSRTPSAIQGPAPATAAAIGDILRRWSGA